MKRTRKRDEKPELRDWRLLIIMATGAVLILLGMIP